jgi:O-antigen ligase
VGGVYEWAGAPLLVAAALLALLSRPLAERPSDSRHLDIALIATFAAVALQLLPLPPQLASAISPASAAVRSAMYLAPESRPAWQPLALSLGSAAYAAALLVSVIVVFWAARKACSAGMARRLVRIVAIAGLVAASGAIVLRAVSDPTLIYGRWRPLDAGARPFGPFVNRNHFATWLVMACPLAAAYVVAAAVGRRRSESKLTAKAIQLFEWLGSDAAWVGAAGIVMTIALVVSTSRSGLVAFGTSLVAGVYLSRRQFTKERAVIGAVAALTVVAAILAFVNMEPLLSRVDETLAVGAGGRSQIWHETLLLIRWFWLTGTGLGGYQTAMIVYQQPNGTIFINQAHNQYLQLLAEGGLLVTIPLLACLVTFVRLVKTRLAEDTSSTQWLRIGGAVAMIAVAVQGLWETGLRIPANAVLFAIAAAIAAHRPAKSQSPDHKLPTHRAS